MVRFVKSEVPIYEYSRKEGGGQVFYHFYYWEEGIIFINIFDFIREKANISNNS